MKKYISVTDTVKRSDRYQIPPFNVVRSEVSADRAGDRLLLPLTVTAWPPSHLPEL